MVFAPLAKGAALYGVTLTVAGNCNYGCVLLVDLSSIAECTKAFRVTFSVKTVAQKANVYRQLQECYAASRHKLTMQEEERRR